MCIEDTRKGAFFMAEPTNSESKTGGPMSRAQLYAIVQSHSKEAIRTLVEIMNTSRNEGMRMGAAKAILDKCVPDLKATEITGENGGDVLIRLITEADAKSNSGSTDQELPGTTNDL